MENDDFQKLLSSLCPSYKLPSRQTLRDKILQQAQLVKQAVCQGHSRELVIIFITFYYNYLLIFIY